MKVSLKNSKLGGFIPSVSFPVVGSCRCDAPCFAECYALKGHYGCPSVKKSLLENITEYNADPQGFFDKINEYLNNGLVIYKYFRWFASGDIVNKMFFDLMVELALKNPLTQFMAFTKKYYIVNDYITLHGKLPNNLKIVFSHWDKTWAVNNPYELPCSYIIFKNQDKNENIPSNAIPCSGKCDKCLGCWHLKNGQAVQFKQH